MRDLTWICSDGGPILAISNELAAHWRGTSPPVGTEVPSGWTWGNGGIMCDYDRACEMDATVSVGEFHYSWSVAVADGHGLLLDGETSTTAVYWEDGVVLLRDAPITTEAQALEILSALEPTAWHALPYEIELGQGRLFVFDSAYEGALTAAQVDASGGILDVPLEPGMYRVLQAAPGPPFDRLALIHLVPLRKPA